MKLFQRIKTQLELLTERDEAIVAYNKNRTSLAKGKICHAPFVSMRFSLNGNVLSCCYNREYILGHVAQDSLHDIWFGERLKTMRKALLQHDFSKGCSQCKVEIDNNNHYNSGAINYDYLAPDRTAVYPIMLDFEADNHCNYECIMCNGEYSSTILNVREKLPERKKVYDESFLTQLDEFIPHIREARFVGGEPFLIEMYIEIWEKIIALNANARISILTNGSVLNERIKTLLQKGNFDVSFSIDSLDSYNYNTIRKRGNLNKVLSNFAEIRTILISRDKPTSINTCLMRQNWQDIAEIVRFCNSQDVSLFFHTVFYPFHTSLWNLPSAELKEIHTQVASEQFEPAATAIQQENLKKYADFVGQVEVLIKNAQAIIDKRQALQTKSVTEITAQFTTTMVGHYALGFLEFTSAEENCFTQKLTRLYSAIAPDTLKRSLIELYAAAHAAGVWRVS
jgi:radical SAM protein with 4Fe4S-binding SPASM domain